MATNKSAKLLSFSDIEQAKDLDYKDVYIEQWKGNVRVQALPADEAMEFSDSIGNEAGKRNSHIRLVALCCVDENGARLFTDEKVKVLAKKNVRVINLLTKECLAINGLGKDAQAEAKNDSSGTPGGVSPTA